MTMQLFTNASVRMLAGILVSAALSSLYSRGGVAWIVGFIFLVPWLSTLGAQLTLARTLLNAYLMSIAFTVAVFGWFAGAIGNYTGGGFALGLLVLVVAAPLFQPQFIAYALVRRIAGQRHGACVRALAAASAWLATEWIVPRMLGDTIGYGLYPATVLRQAADLGGVAGLSLLLLLANEAFALAITRRGDGMKAAAVPLAMAALVPLLLFAYGRTAVMALPPSGDTQLRIGMIQSNMVDYDRQRQQKGAYQVVREVLDTHYKMSYDAVVRQKVDAVLWSETAYPTTFGHPKSAAGSELDLEISEIVTSAQVPFVFGTFDRDSDGEYNAAAFVEPGTGLLGFYRKTRLFPLTEYVPPWLDGPVLRRWLPWLGSWQPGTGARVIPLRLADGREIPALPLICLDDTDSGLVLEGARQGAQVILTMSNDSWFTHPDGARLHHAAAAFRSIETRLPQFRVTTNGFSAVIDATGAVLAGGRRGERVLVVGALAVPNPPRTLMVAWGDWVGRAAACFLACLALIAACRALPKAPLDQVHAADAIASLPCKVVVLPPWLRWFTGLLRTFARLSLLWLGAMLLVTDAVGTNTLAQIRIFLVFFVLPEALVWCLLHAFSAHASVENGALVVARGANRLVLALQDITAIARWRFPLPTKGMAFHTTAGRWPYALGLDKPEALTNALLQAGMQAATVQAASTAIRYQDIGSAIGRMRLDRPVLKFVLLPMVLAIPAFYLHQHIAYGSGLGEYRAFGLRAYLTGFLLWWAGWAVAVALSAAALRALIEAAALLAAWLRPAAALNTRYWLERAGLAALFLGPPAWLALRVFRA